MNKQKLIINSHEQQKQMDKEDLEWLQSVQSQAYRLYAINKMPENYYNLLDNTIDEILSNNSVNTDEQDI